MASGFFLFFRSFAWEERVRGILDPMQKYDELFTLGGFAWASTLRTSAVIYMQIPSYLGASLQFLLLISMDLGLGYKHPIKTTPPSPPQFVSFNH